MFWDNFYNLCIATGKKPNPVAKELGISSGALTKWKTEGVMPNLKTALDIASYFHVSLDELIKGSPVKCYRCGFINNQASATYCKKCGNILNDNFCTNPDCDADGRFDSSPILLSSDSEYCPFCGSESKYKQEGLFSLSFNHAPSEQNIDIDEKLYEYIQKLSTNEQKELIGYVKRMIEEKITTDDEKELPNAAGK